MKEGIPPFPRDGAELDTLDQYRRKNVTCF